MTAEVSKNRPPSSGRTEKKLRSRKRKSLQPSWRPALIFLSPWILGFGVFTAWPVLYSGYLSLTDYDVINDPQFIGFENFQKLMEDEKLRTALWNTFYFTIIQVPLLILLALALALLLNRAGRASGFFRTAFFLPKMTPPVAVGIMLLLLFNGQNGLINKVLGVFGISRSEEHTSELQSRGHLVCRLLLEEKKSSRHGALSPLPPSPSRSLSFLPPPPPTAPPFPYTTLFRSNRAGRASGFFRTAFFLPKMTPPVAVGIMLLLLFNGQNGLINKVLGVFGISGPAWTTDPSWVKPGLILMSLWTVGSSVIILLAALRNVPNEMYESARVDGANFMQQTTRITIPMISGTIFFLVIVNTIAGFQTFTEAYTAFFGAGNSTYSNDSALFYVIYLFQQAFEYFEMGYASAMAWLLFVVIMIVTVIQLRVSKRFVYYEGEES